jgi:hypothetical protein
MAQVKNSFLKSKMNKDLDDRLIPNGEYRDAVNITVNQSDGEDVGTAQTILGNTEVIDYNTVTGQSGLKTIGILNQDSTNTIFAFVTNNSVSNYNKQAYNAIISWQTDLNNTTAKIIVQGNWLNFSTLNPITGINLLEDLLFFTDNRNQPRKVNISKQEGYYTTEDQISVAKYYPYQAIELFQPSAISGAAVVTTTTTAASTTNIIAVASNSNIDQGQGVLGTGIPLNVFVIAIDSLNITLSQAVNVVNGASITFCLAESSMQDAISEYLPPQGRGTVTGVPPSTTQFNLSQYSGYVNPVGNVSGAAGFRVYIKQLDGSYSITPATVTVFNKDSANGGFLITTDVASGVTNTDEVLLAIPNPYYDSNFAATANVDYLEDKFVRFSYRFKFDDGEYSLIAPFTQACFIPKQDGYFLDASFSDDEASTDVDKNISDFARAYQSTEVSFMENKVNKILLNIPLPYKAGELANSLKVEELEILYKESDEIAIKVVESLPLSDNFSGDDYYFQYEYGSKSPYKSLPEKENTRVYDKVPVKAQSQEIISNRVVYGNYQDKHTPPNFLDYNISAREKASFGPGINGLGSSKIEYPNANLKQNRNYEVGIVLSDRFGRQSTVILSESELNQLPSYLASTIYSSYRTKQDQATNPELFDGDSLKVTFNNFIPSSYPNSPGLYEGNKDLSSYNPLGWYTFKIVVKQTEQDYYNAYVAPIMQGYPTDNNKEKFDTSHISLFGDNINKVPRDLSELGPTQKQFRSSVKLWPRVAGDENTNSPFYNAIQFFPERTGDIASAIGTLDDLFELPDAPGNVIGSFGISGVESNTTNTLTFSLGASPSPALQGIFLGISEGDEIRGINFGYKDTIITDIVTPQTPPLSGVFKLSVSNPPQGSPNGNNISFHRSGGKNYFYNQESDPLIARISTTKQAGVEIPAEYPDSGGALNIYEVEAQESLLDIYWETSTSGLISELNQAIAEGPGGLIYDRVQGWTPIITEATDQNDNPIVSNFRAVLLNGTQITPVADATATIVSVYEQGSPSNTNNLLGNPYKDAFAVTSLGTGYFKLDLSIDPSELVYTQGVNTLTFEVLFNHTNADAPFTAYLDIPVNNVAPAIGNKPSNDAVLITFKTQAVYNAFTGVNGSDTSSLNQEGLVWSFGPNVNTALFSIDSSTGVVTANQLETPNGSYTIDVILTDAGGLQDLYSFTVTYNRAATIVWSPNGDQIVDVNNVDNPGGGNITITQTGTVTITNGDFNIKLRGQHQGSNTSAWSTSFNASVGSTNYSEPLFNQTAPSIIESSNTLFSSGVYNFSITVATTSLPTGALAQSLGSLIATVA